MLTKEQYLEAHSKFYDLVQEENALYSKYLSYDEYKIEIPDRVDLRLGLASKPMAEEFVRELLNEINGFCSILIDVDACEKVLKNYSDEKMKLNILNIFNPLLHIALNMPYAIKGRFIYASVRLLHETAFLIDENYKWKNFLEKNISLEDLKKFKPLSEKQNWKSFALFLCDLEQIHSQQHIKDTSNFRHSFHHRLPPNIEIGISWLVRPIKHDGEGTTYTFGIQPPLSISKLLISLQSEHEACIKTFQAFWLLLKDQLEIWKQKCVPVE